MTFRFNLSLLQIQLKVTNTPKTSNKEGANAHSGTRFKSRSNSFDDMQTQPSERSATSSKWRQLQPLPGTNSFGDFGEMSGVILTEFQFKFSLKWQKKAIKCDSMCLILVYKNQRKQIIPITLSIDSSIWNAAQE